MITPNNIKERIRYIDSVISLYEREKDVLNKLIEIYSQPAYSDIKELEDTLIKEERRNNRREEIISKDSFNTSNDTEASISTKLEFAVDLIYNNCKNSNMTIVDLRPEKFKNLSNWAFYEGINILIRRGFLERTIGPCKYKIIGLKK